ncbi:hypothetical protein ACP4OV_020844 [Aristida adscensionis]
MAPLPSPAPPQPRWAVLRREACVDAGLPPGIGCRARGWRAPGLTELFLAPLVDGGSGAPVRDLLVLAADASGLLLLSGSLDGERTAYFLCDAVANTVRQLPAAAARRGFPTPGRSCAPLSDDRRISLYFKIWATFSDVE